MATSSRNIDDGARGDGSVATALLLDFDGTLCPVDVTAEIFPALARRGWRETLEAARIESRGSRLAQEALIPFLPQDRASLLAFAAAHELDAEAGPLVDTARRAGWIVEVVSDGLGLYVPPMLERGGLRVGVRCADLIPDGDRLRLVAPWAGRPGSVCPGCTTCKVDAIADHHSAGRRVILVGDGRSDRIAAALADVTYATGLLAQHCASEGIAFRPWRRLGDVRADLARRGELPDDGSSLAGRDGPVDREWAVDSHGTARRAGAPGRNAALP